MGKFETFALGIAPPRALLVVNALVHAMLAGVILQAIAEGIRPAAALWSACALVLMHAAYEHRRLVTPGMQLWIDSGRLQLSVGLAADQTVARADYWQLRRVTCATRWLCIAELQGIAPHARARQWLIVGGDQLCETDARRLLRWLRAGVRAV